MSVVADTAGVEAALKASRRAMDQDFKAALQDVGDRRIMPVARSVAPSAIRNTIAVKATTRRAYVTTTARDKQRKGIFALTEFGGTVNTVIVPKNAKALRYADGRFSAATRGPRRYKGKHRMEEAVRHHIPVFEREVATRLEVAVSRRLERGL